MNAMRLFLASGGALLAAVIWQMMRRDQASKGEESVIWGIKGASFAGIVFAAFLAIKESLFWEAVISSFIALSAFAYFLPTHFAHFEQEAPPYIALALPFAFGYIVAFYNRGRMGKFFSIIILAILITAFMERYGGDVH